MRVIQLIGRFSFRSVIVFSARSATVQCTGRRPALASATIC